jgi:hypothetical protein
VVAGVQLTKVLIDDSKGVKFHLCEHAKEDVTTIRRRSASGSYQIDDMHGEGGCSYQSDLTTVVEDGGARGARARGRRRSASGSGTAAQLNSLAAQHLCQLGRELARVPAGSNTPFILYTHRRRIFRKTACDI